MTLKERYQVWRLRPGLLFAAKLAEQQSWKHPNSSMLGPEQNLKTLAVSIGIRIAAADRGDLTGLYLDATTPIGKLRTVINRLSESKSWMQIS